MPGPLCAAGQSAFSARGKAAGVLAAFYYLAPLWFVLETLFWPGFRAGAVVGSGLAGRIAFYSVEAGLGAALWFRMPYAELCALVENALYLLCALGFVLLTPLDIALSLTEDGGAAAQSAAGYAASLPGVLYSAAHVTVRMSATLNRRG